MVLSMSCWMTIGPTCQWCAVPPGLSPQPELVPSSCRLWRSPMSVEWHANMWAQYHIRWQLLNNDTSNSGTKHAPITRKAWRHQIEFLAHRWRVVDVLRLWSSIVMGCFFQSLQRNWATVTFLADNNVHHAMPVKLVLIKLHLSQKAKD